MGRKPVAPSTIRCEHCDAEVKTKRPDLRRFCDTCRVVRAIMALGQRPQTCEGCGQAFYPADQDHARGHTCHRCSFSPAGAAGDGRDPCVYCGGTTRLLPEAAICYLCVQQPSDAEHPKHHARVKRSLVTFMAARAKSG